MLPSIRPVSASVTQATAATDGEDHRPHPDGGGHLG